MNSLLSNITITYRWYNYFIRIIWSTSMTYGSTLSHIISQYIQSLKNQFNWIVWIKSRKTFEVRGEGIRTSRK